MQGDNALDRLLNSVNDEGATNYSVEEQIKSATSSDNADEILEGMSAESKDALFKATEVKLDDTPSVTVQEPQNEKDLPQNEKDLPQNEPNLAQNGENSSNYALFNSIEEKKQQEKEEVVVQQEEKPKRKAGRPKKSENTNTTQPVPIIQENNTNSDNYNPIMNQLVKDLIDNLRKDKYKINRFDNQTMEIIYQYIYEKF